ncbi:hypothetical protein IT157_03355 [bacterium]|nr:hypothetical protein [bacterium]
MSSTSSVDRELATRLRETDLVTDEQLEVVRQLQSGSSLSLAEALTQLDLLSESELAGIVSSIRQVRQINIEEVDVDREAVRHVPAAVAVRYRLLPLRRSGNSLVVAMSDPQDPTALQALRDVTDHEIVPFLADPEAMEHALHLYYEAAADGEGARIERGESGIARSSEDSWRCESPYPPTLDNFLECDGNRQARNLSYQIAANSRDVYSCPILFVGPAGCGKSHLLHAIGSYVARKHPMMKGLLVTGAELKERIADFALAGQSQLLRYELRDRNFVLIHGLGDVSGARAVEQELCDLITAARKRNVWVVCTLTADELINPSWLPCLRKELENGLIVNIDAPDASTRRALLHRHASGGLCDASTLDRLSAISDLQTSLSELRAEILKSGNASDTEQ